MKMLIRNYFIGIFLLLSSCNILTTGSLPTTVPNLPKETHYQSEATITPVVPDWQASVSPTLIQTSELPIITSTPIPTKLSEELSQTPTLTPTVTQEQPLLDVQIGSPVGTINFAHPELGCKWMGLAGQIIGIDDQPVKDIVVEVGGTLNGLPFFGLAVTGESSVYGPGGFEVKLGNEPIASDGTLWAMVYDLDGNIISSPVYFSTYADCEKNLTLLNFVQFRTLSSDWVYIPVIYNKFSRP